MLGSSEANPFYIILSSFRDAVQPFLLLMYKPGTREIAESIKTQLLYLLKKWFSLVLLLVVTSIHLDTKANIEGHRGGGLNAQAMN